MKCTAWMCFRQVVQDGCEEITMNDNHSFHFCFHLSSLPKLCVNIRVLIYSIVSPSQLAMLEWYPSNFKCRVCFQNIWKLFIIFIWGAIKKSLLNEIYVIAEFLWEAHFILYMLCFWGSWHSWTSLEYDCLSNVLIFLNHVLPECVVSQACSQGFMWNWCMDYISDNIDNCHVLNWVGHFIGDCTEVPAPLKTSIAQNKKKKFEKEIKSIITLSL